MLLTKHDVEMAGYWPNYFLVLLWTETKSRYIKMGKKKVLCSHLDRTCLQNKESIELNDFTLLRIES